MCTRLAPERVFYAAGSQTTAITFNYLHVQTYI